MAKVLTALRINVPQTAEMLGFRVAIFGITLA